MARLRPHLQLLCLAFSLLVSNGPAYGAQEPVHEGRTVSSWLQDFAIGRFPDMEKHRAAVEAIRAIGADAVPVLVERLRVTPDPLDSTQDIHTLSAFRAIGPKAKPAIPDLIALLAPAYDAARRSGPIAEVQHRKSIYAALALREIGQDSVIPLTQALASDNAKVRFGTAMASQYFVRHAKEVLPALIRSLEDTDCHVRWRAARSIGDFRAMPELSVPALIKTAREDEAANVRSYAISALVKLGPIARESIPYLELLQGYSEYADRKNPKKVGATPAKSPRTDAAGFRP